MTTINRFRESLEKAMAERRDKIYELRNKGLTFEEIAKITGLTRQRVWQIYSQSK